MPGGGTLCFRAAPCRALPDDIGGGIDAFDAAGGFVLIAISDSGSGMSAEVKERAFEPFFTTKEAGRGTGLGLSTVYGFVKQSKGAVALESELDRGTTLTLYVPGPTEAASATIVAAPGRSVPAGLRVLLVEDHFDVRAVMRRFLDAFHCVVSEASSAEQALLAIGAGQRFDVLLTDIALGAGMRGTELAARVQKRLPEIAVVLMSGYSAELLEADSGSPPAWELVRKPCSREELGEAIARAFDAGATR